MNVNPRTFKTRSWFGILTTQADINYVKNLRYKFLVIGNNRRGFHLCLIQFANPRPRPGTQSQLWRKSRTIEDSIKRIDRDGPYAFKKGQLDVWSARRSDLNFLRDWIGVKYYKWH